ncbi:MAG: filamentous hemagglutinin N-terminal domain-containing protein, partial [Gammaproteobacteria bacterium]
MNHRNLPGFLNPMLRAAQRAPHDRWLAGIAGALGALAPVLAFANPTGGQVVAGSATIGSAGSNGVIVNQNSQRAAINWQQFSIGSNEYVQFNQPNSSSVVLNRVTGSNPSSIFGQIRANGQVFLINPNGILFAPGSSLDVSGLTASTLDISDADFMAGRYVFSRDPGSSAATVVNQGNLTVTSGGYVVHSGDYVANDGVIQAQAGRVVL